MNTFGEFNLFDMDTWFGGPGLDGSSAGSAGTGGSFMGDIGDNLFGYNPLLEPKPPTPGADTGNSFTMPDYFASGGVMTPPAQSSGGSTDDIFAGLSDFFSGFTQALPGLVNTGLSTWQSVQNIINQQNALNATRDELVYLPGQRTPVIKRTQGSTTTYHPIVDLYPSLAPQVQQAQQSQNWLLPVALVGILGIGFILISKKK